MQSPTPENPQNPPIFSGREVANIRLTRKVCGHCHGKGKVIEKIYSAFARRNYVNQYETQLMTCNFCGGIGSIDPTPVADGKMAAAGGAA
jgi:RecJ-like exonuclease